MLEVEMRRGREREHFDGKDGLEPLNAEDLAYFKERLGAQREEVKQRLARHLGESLNDSGACPDDLDRAGAISNQAYLMRLADKERKLLKQIDNALRKFEFGEYGYCEGTGEPINRKRLELRPWTRYSIEYKERLERQKAHRRQVRRD